MKLLLTTFLASCATALASELSLVDADGKLTVNHGASEILVYHTAELAPPKGMDDAFRRSGFIHPLRSPQGGVLTGIHPDDHVHHLGLWHAWVQTVHGEDQPDFWNIGKKTGRVRFKKLLRKIEKPGEVGFSVEQEQVAYKGKGKQETVVLGEEFTVTAKVESGFNIIDYTLKQTNVSDLALELPAYRYGGPLAYRGPLNWNKKNSEYLTSEGKTRKDSHTTRAKWCAVFGPTETGESTLVFLGHPENYDAPQRLRTWPDGKMFLNWAAAQETGFKIEPGKSMTWKYRLIAADGKLSAERMEKEWVRWTGVE